MRRLLPFLLILVLLACQEPAENFTPFSIQKDGDCSDLGDGFSLPTNQIVGGALSLDGIPSIDNPTFIAIHEVDYLKDEELVVGIQIGEDVWLFPHRIMDFHEIVNVSEDTHSFSVTFCPLTGTGITWPKLIDSSFGVSGLLYNSNLIPYDRTTESKYSQMYSIGISGTEQCASTGFIKTVETRWETWKKWTPEANVLSLETGFTRDYERTPVSFTQPALSEPQFPVNHTDDRLANYQRVFGVIIDGRAKVFDLQAFEDQVVIRDFFQGKEIVVVGDYNDDWASAFYPKLGTRNIQLSYAAGVLSDDSGNSFDLFGRVISGPDEGLKLESPFTYSGYWFAWAAFYPELELFTPREITE